MRDLGRRVSRPGLNSRPNKRRTSLPQRVQLRDASTARQGRSRVDGLKAGGRLGAGCADERIAMTMIKRILVLGCLMTGTLLAQQAKVTELMSKDLTEFPGKEGLMITVEYPPGSSDPVHRHYANAFVYVLEGTIVMQVKGGKEVTLTPGQTFYEGPEDIHIVGRNASKTKPARFVVFLVKDKGAPVFVPAN